MSAGFDSNFAQNSNPKTSREDGEKDVFVPATVVKVEDVKLRQARLERIASDPRFKKESKSQKERFTPEFEMYICTRVGCGTSMSPAQALVPDRSVFSKELGKEKFLTDDLKVLAVCGRRCVELKYGPDCRSYRHNLVYRQLLSDQQRDYERKQRRAQYFPRSERKAPGAKTKGAFGNVQNSGSDSYRAKKAAKRAASKELRDGMKGSENGQTGADRAGKKK